MDAGRPVTRRGVVPLALALTSLFLLGHATPAGASAPQPASVGSPTDGRLEAGVRLQENDGRLRLRNAAGAVWGLPELVRLIDKSARTVNRKFPGSVLLVGDLSLRRGGSIGGHHSHESGRDADVGFYFVGRDGKPAATEQFLRVLWNGRAADRPDLEFDDARNWALVQSWMTSSDARVQHIFVAEPLRRRLLKHATAAGVYLPVRHRAAIAMKQPTRGLPHDDHFHVRIRCPSDQRDVCISEPDRPRSPRPKARPARPRPLSAGKPGRAEAG